MKRLGVLKGLLLYVAAVMMSLSMVAVVNAAPVEGNADTVWYTTDGDVNYTLIGWDTADSLIVDPTNGASITIQSDATTFPYFYAETVTIPSPGTFTISAEIDSITYTNYLYTVLEINKEYLIDFVDSNGVSVMGGAITLQVDAAPVPIPATALLFCSSILGIVGIRRKMSK